MVKKYSPIVIETLDENATISRTAFHSHQPSCIHPFQAPIVQNSCLIRDTGTFLFRVHVQLSPVLCEVKLVA